MHRSRAPSRPPRHTRSWRRRRRRRRRGRGRGGGCRVQGSTARVQGTLRRGALCCGGPRRQHGGIHTCACTYTCHVRTIHSNPHPSSPQVAPPAALTPPPTIHNNPPPLHSRWRRPLLSLLAAAVGVTALGACTLYPSTAQLGASPSIAQLGLVHSTIYSTCARQGGCQPAGGRGPRAGAGGPRAGGALRTLLGPVGECTVSK